MSTKINRADTALRIYYCLKPVIPRSIQVWFRRMIVRNKRPLTSTYWPIKESAGTRPLHWTGWPQNKKMGVLLTHDVENYRGHSKCRQLAEIEMSFGFRSLYNFVPERYDVHPELREWLKANGFEIGVHGLKHDGNLYNSYELFQKRAAKINQYLAKWQSVGFRSPAMHHDLAWIGELDIAYDLSTFDTDPFEPQSDGVNTIFPFWVARSDGRPPYLEMPYTLPQDHTLFIIMQEKSIDIWKEKIDWIAEKGGMVLVNVHPDYVHFGKKTNLEEYPIDYYLELLEYIQRRYAGQYWHGLPQDLLAYCISTDTEDRTARHRYSTELASHRIPEPIHQRETAQNVVA